VAGLTKPNQQLPTTSPSQNADEGCVGSPQRGSGVNESKQRASYAVAAPMGVETVVVIS
jgi:hypothetical protein